MDVCAIFSFVVISCSSFYITPINSCPRSPQPSYDRALDYYDAYRDQHLILEWKAIISSPIDEWSSMQQLENEANNMNGKRDSQMSEYLNRAMDVYHHVSGMTQAECLVVIMFTDDSDERAFFREYNRASANRIWQPYKVYTTLLVSALRKLTEIDPIPPGATLYRGLNFKAEPPRARQIFWKAFTSTSLDIKVAEGFAGPDGTILEFQPPASRRAARIRKLSNYYEEDEVLLLPFEAFHFIYP